jgi:hypothetical protein
MTVLFWEITHLSFELFELTENLILGFHEVDLGLPGEIINEGYIIRCTLH